MSQAVFGRAFKASKCLPWVIAAIAIGGCNQGGSSSTGGAPTASSGGGASAQSASSTLSISGTPPAQVVANQLYSFVPKVIAPAGSVYSFSISNKPSWATFSTVNGSLSGTPSASNVGTDGNIVISMSNAQSTVALAAFAIVVSAAAPPGSTASTSASGGISYPSGFANAANAIQTAASAQFSGSVIALTSPKFGTHQAGAAWFKTQENITSFTTDFTFQLDPSAYGITFCIQNSNSKTNPPAYGSAASADTNLLGYGAYALAGQYPILNSIAVKFDLTGDGQRDYVATPNATGLYIDGGPAGTLLPEIDLNPSGINLHSGDIMAAHIVYDGSILTLTLKDTVTNAQFRTSWAINIPSIVGSDYAWVGFTAGTIPAVAQDLLSWTFSDGYEPILPAPSFGVAGGAYTSEQSVSINADQGATIYYTTNGQQPTTSSSIYTGPISVRSNEVVQAFAVEAGYTDSPAAIANYQIAPAGTPLINFQNGFANASSLVIVNGSSQFSGSAIQLTDATYNLEAGSAWYAVPVNVQSFTTSFTIQLLNPMANGMTFTIQNQPPSSSDSSDLYVSGGPYAVANNQSGLGYAGLLNSVAVKFDLYTGTGNSTGLYTNGILPSTLNLLDMTSSGLSLHSGNPLAVTIAYNGATLTMTITDTKTHASFSNSWSIDIPTAVGGDTAYVGFTGATGGENALQDVLSWTYSN